MHHILYSRGRLLEKTDWNKAVEQLSVLTKRPIDQVEEQLLGGSRKRIKSSDSLEKILRLKRKLSETGLDVFVESASITTNEQSLQNL